MDPLVSFNELAHLNIGRQKSTANYLEVRCGRFLKQCCLLLAVVVAKAGRFASHLAGLCDCNSSFQCNLLIDAKVRHAGQDKGRLVIQLQALLSPMGLH